MSHVGQPATLPIRVFDPHRPAKSLTWASIESSSTVGGSGSRRAGWPRGRSRGSSWAGIPPTGKRFRFSGISICRLAEGKMAEQFEQWDRLDLMQQLGVIPAVGQGRS